MRYGVAVLLLACLMLGGCKGNPEGLTVVEKSFKSQQNVSTSGLSEFGASGGGQAAATLFWIEGKIANTAPTSYRTVMITFHVQDSGSKRVLTAEIESVPAGKTVMFRTNTLQSYANVRLLDEPPEINAEEVEE